MFELTNFDAIQISLASPEKIREWSHGEVKKPETINYRTLKPERDGLYCERIFGPTKDWECHCGRYKRVRYKGVVCEKCGVEVTKAKVRRERMGHIELAAPVSHIWYFKGIPCRMKMLLDMSPRSLEKVLYFVSYVVTDPGTTPLEYKQLLTDKEYHDAQEEYGAKSFKAGMGAEAIKELLMQIDLEKTEVELREEIAHSSGQKRTNAIKRLEVIEAFIKSGNKPEWIILDVIPVIPPDLRPMVPLDGGRFATSDLNDLYRRVINRNNRLKRLLELRAPDIIIRNEKRMLQEAVDALIDNGRRGRPVTGPGNRALKSLSDMLRGKQGRFRQNLLGKRVDYSGRSVIVVGPELKMYQCGLPKEMALELFKPFVMKKLTELGYAHNIKSAKRMVERVRPEVWDVLEDVIKDHPVLLNRAPTLHRLGIQAFEPVLVEGRAIKLHPLVCTAFNADFDGDQMPVHVPLSVEAQAEARFLMLAANNILKPQDGKPVISPAQDMVMGCYYITMRSDELYDKEIRKTVRSIVNNDAYVDEKLTDDVIFNIYSRKDEESRNEFINGAKQVNPELDEEKLFRYLTDSRLVRMLNGERKAFSSEEEALMAYQTGALSLHALVKIRIEREYEGKTYRRIIENSIGRIIFNHVIPQDLGYVERNTLDDMFKLEVDKLVIKKDLGNIIDRCYRKHGPTVTSEVADRIKNLGYRYSTIGGVTIGFQDITVPEEKRGYLDAADAECARIDNLYRMGLLSREDRRNKVIEVWKDTEAKVTDTLMNKLSPINPIFMMANSGARGSTNQIRQLAGMRGLMADPRGQIIEVPIRSNFREGLNVLEFFISSHGARKGLADTALRTADSGYLTRRLVDVSQDVIVREEDCDVQVLNFDREQSLIASQPEVKKTIMGLKQTLLGAVLDEDVLDRRNGDILLVKGKTLDADDVTLLNRHLVEHISVIIPTADGIEAAEPKTFDLGTQDAVAEYNRAMHHHLTVHFAGKKLEEDAYDRQGNVLFPAGTVIDSDVAEKILVSDIPVLKVRMDEAEGVEVSLIEEKGQPIESLADRIAGRCPLEDVVNPTTGEVIAKKNEEISDAQAEEIQKYYDKLKVRSILTCHSAHGVCAKCYGRNLATGRHVEIGEAVGIIAAQSIGEPGTQLTMRTFHTGGVASAEDITQGLPRVEELFEARKPKGNAIISRIDGTVSITSAEDNPNVKIITITSNDPDIAPESEKIPVAKKISVTNGEFIKAGTRLFEGNINPHDILDVLGVQATQNYIVKEVQKVYRSQGVEINDKHIEIIVHQMLRKIKITEPGGSGWLPGETVDIVAFRAMNQRLDDEGKDRAVGENLLLGTTKAALATDSFLSAASFQETTRVLTEAAIKGKEDPLLGLKENVIIGKLIPAGTGMSRYRKLNVIHKGESFETGSDAE